MKYQDYVIKNGKFIGKFDDMYRKFLDPWHLLSNNKNNNNLNYEIIWNYCKQIKFKKLKPITLEIGCGYPQISSHLNKIGFGSFGTDISKTVIDNSKIKFPEIKNNLYVSEFINFELYESINPDIIILSDISWYVLPDLKKFIKWFKSIKKPIYLVHSLAVYEKNKQKYGNKYFDDLDSIKKYFNLKYINSGYMENLNSDRHTFFLGINK
jgi:SAM-dependent methyltransferase